MHAADKDSTPADWAHIYLSVLSPLPLGCPQAGDAARVAAALKSAAAAAVASHSTELRKAAVAQWEFRLRVNEAVGEAASPWRVVVSLPSGTRFCCIGSSRLAVASNITELRKAAVS